MLTSGGVMRKFIAALIAVAGIGTLAAQQPGFTRKLVQDQDLSIADRHAVQALAEFVPGGAAGKHTHPGEELGYVVEGTLELLIDGQPPPIVKAGEAFFVPAGVVHDGRNAGSGLTPGGGFSLRRRQPKRNR